MDRATYQRTIDTLRTSLNRAKLGQSDRLNALKRLARVEQQPQLAHAG